MATRTIPISEHARDGGLALALASTPDQRRRNTELARFSSMDTRARKAGKPGMAARIAEAEAELDTITDPVERQRREGWIAQAKDNLARLEQLRQQREETAQLEAS